VSTRTLWLDLEPFFSYPSSSFPGLPLPVPFTSFKGAAVQYPFLFQYKVQPSASHQDWSRLGGAIATVLVFADSGAQGRSRCVRFLTGKQYDIIEFLRAMIVCPHQVDNFDAALGKVYREAELCGIAACFDGWAKHPHH
jgi:hypothetical protein